MTFEKYKAFIFDLDGTVYLGDDIIPGAVEALTWIREKGAKVRFVTNNPRFSREFYAEKLNNLGIEANIDEIVTSAKFTADYLKKNKEFGNIFVVGEQQLNNELEKAELPIVDSLSADTVLVSFDTTLTYDKLQKAYLNLKNGARFIATIPDSVCPTPQGGLVDAGSIIAALETATQRTIEEVIGNPSKLLGTLLIEELNVPAENCVVVGDRLNTDVKLAKQSNMNAIWIRANNEEIPGDISFQPDLTINSIAELPQLITT